MYRIVPGQNLFCIHCHQGEQKPYCQNGLHPIYKDRVFFAFSIHQHEPLQRPHIHPSIHAAADSPARKTTKPFNLLDSSPVCVLLPVKKLHLRCTSTSSGGTIRIPSAAFPSRPSFVCRIDPWVKWDHWRFQLTAGEVAALNGCRASERGLQSHWRKG